MAPTRTAPNTREHQDNLEKVATAGQFFAVTGGGGVLNQADFLIAAERKRMRGEGEELEKVKKNVVDFHERKRIPRKACTVYKKGYENWKKDDFQIAIQFRRGPNPAKGVKPLSKLQSAGLKREYEKNHFGNPGRKWKPWSPKQEAELQRLLSGEISSLEETVIYGRALEAQNEFLSTKLQVCSRPRRLQVLGTLFETLTEEEKEDLRNLLDDNAIESRRNLDDTSDESSNEESSLVTLVEDVDETDEDEYKFREPSITGEEEGEFEDEDEKEDSVPYESDLESSEAGYVSPGSVEEEEIESEDEEEEGKRNTKDKEQTE
jgi:hypothetical protein